MANGHLCLNPTTGHLRFAASGHLLNVCETPCGCPPGLVPSAWLVTFNAIQLATSCIISPSGFRRAKIVTGQAEYSNSIILPPRGVCGYGILDTNPAYKYSFKQFGSDCEPQPNPEQFLSIGLSLANPLGVPLISVSMGDAPAQAQVSIFVAVGGTCADGASLANTNTAFSVENNLNFATLGKGGSVTATPIF